MRNLSFSLAVTIVVLVFGIYAQDFTKLVFRDCGSKSADIEQVDMTPMPLYNPGPAYFTFVASLKRPVDVVEVSLEIIRSVNGIKLPVRCYIVDGTYVGSCTYPDLCVFLESILTEFKPDTCSPILLANNINCKCPFNLPIQKLQVEKLLLELPDATQTAASFLASGNFNITVVVKEKNPSAPSPYGCGNAQVTVKQKK